MSRGIWRPLGFDIETSSIEPNDGVILSIGAYDPQTGRSFYEELRWDNLRVSPSAMRVNRIDITKVDGAQNSIGGQRLRNDVCDVALAKWLSEHGYEDGCDYIPTGLNVGSFDIKWISQFMPKSRSKFGHRFIDLNSLYFRKSFAANYGFKGIRSVVSLEASKRMEPITEKIRQEYLLNGYDLEWGPHHALYDAIHACCAFEVVCEANTFGELCTLSDSEE